MRAVAKIDDRQIAGMDLDITFRMTVAEWRELMRQMPCDWSVGHKLGKHISSVLGHVTNATAVTFTEPKHAADEG